MPITHRHTHGRATMYGMARHAGWYDRHAGILAGPLYRRVVRDVVAAGLPSGAVVLDVGTGPGRVPKMIAAARPDLSVHGIDLSAEMIARATAIAATSDSAASDSDSAASAASDSAAGPLAGAQPVRFQVADVAALPFADGSVDLVVSSISQHHWEDPAAGLRDVLRVLRPGAQAWIYDLRPALRHPERMTGALVAEVRLESPLTGTSRFNPIGRLVLRRPADR
jgi:ubiquinone/menaquinone biosynthesis C-methylase UbiE